MDEQQSSQKKREEWPFLFTLLGLDLQAEVQTNRGRIDATIELQKKDGEQLVFHEETQ